MAQDAHLASSIYTFRTNLANDKTTLFYDPPLSLTSTKDSARRNLHISLLNKNTCDGWDSLHLVRPLFFVHICCWKAACQQLKRNLGGQALYWLARQTRPVIPRGPFLKSKDSLLRPPILPTFNKTDLARLLTRIWARLPAELQKEVMGYQSGNLALSLIQACQTAMLIESTEEYHSEPCKVAVEQSCHAANWLGISMTSLFGQEYIGSITLVRRVEKAIPPQDFGVSFNAEAITAVEFVLGTYGLRAVRLGYWDGSSSPWLGEPNQGYFGVTFGTSEDTISIWSDVSKFFVLIASRGIYTYRLFRISG